MSEKVRLYMKKPIPVQARQVTAELELVKTPEGMLSARRGDYILTGVRGEHWPVRKDIFEETYEPYEENDHV